MIDGNRFRVLIPDNKTGVLYDRTESIKWSNPEDGYIKGQFRDGGTRKLASSRGLQTFAI